MPFRIATFLMASALGGGIATALLNWHYAGLGAWLGALLWLLLDAWRAQRLLNVLRSDAAGLPSRGPGIWGELSERIRKLLREREQQTRHAEDRLQEFLAAIQASPNGVVLLDEQGRIEWCNQTAAGQFGIDAERDLLQHMANLVRDPAFVAYLASWHYSRDVVIDAQGPQQRNHPARLSVQVHPYAGNRRMLLTRDITSLEQAEAMRRDFVANVSHEIRTPLTVLAGFVETLQNLPLDAQERARYLGLMAQQSHRMETLVNDLLTLSRLEGSAAPPATRWTRMRALMAQCEDEGRGLSSRLSSQGHQLSFTLQADSEIAGAPTELQSAMSNLLSNAIRYTPGGGEVAVSWRLLPDGRGEYAVRDSGPGIAAEHLPRLTERFYRIDRSRSRETGGTGLGLAIVKHIAQRHGAELRIESTPGKGSRFALVFPVARLRQAAPLSAIA
ncbi:phosphate regulon sensor histidine kinase PhoR [Variovorax saccharolyticus]|uniref:phosphate regulon sensor histidine kinase PhoR n=1 Tax=Variovorax saccharolyticus TaxID=3053516 RepID=UPI0025767590|nr:MULTISPECIES: phosphate regulon sensor histidine kinase PhoR [unclassified Variovorax]MDM0020277.1 phosphate regulon sensor histidine kinase PhoR [Variovorax sp. J22R187]MDM0023908.1 phosphate regulon sensor histidine kinase PhoR [Variovorax sp. J31P216]